MIANDSSPTVGLPESVYDSYSEKQVLAALYSLIFVAGVVGNSSVVLAVLLSRKPRRVANTFLVNLAVVDLVNCLTLPVMILAVLSEGKENLLVSQRLCAFQGLSLVVCVGCSLDNISAIAIHRAFMVIGDRSGSRLVSMYQRVTVVAMVAANWLVPLVLAILPVVFDFGSYGYSEKLSTCTHNLQSNGTGAYSQIVGAVFLLVQVLVTLVGYAAIVWVVRRCFGRFKAIPRVAAVAVVGGNTRLGRSPRRGQAGSREHRRTVAVASTSLQVPARNAQQQRRTVGALFNGWVAGARRPAPTVTRQTCLRTRSVNLSLFLVFFFFFVCCTPYVTAIAVLSDRFNKFVPFLALLLVSNSCINPMIYTAWHPDFKQVIRCILLCRLSKIPMKSGFLRVILCRGG